MTTYNTKNLLIQRLRGENLIDPLGAIPDQRGRAKLESGEEFLRSFAALVTARQKRFAILELIREAPELLRDVLPQIDVIRLAEAVTHRSSPSLRREKDLVLGAMLHIAEHRYAGLSSTEKSIFRKSVCYLDQEIFR